MDTMEIEHPPAPKVQSNVIADQIREEILQYSKDFKTSWVKLGRHLYAVYQDELFLGWGFNKFEDYAQEEIGIKKSLCLKLLKAYLFIEQDEPQYISDGFAENRAAHQVPNYDAVDVLRMAKQKKELLAEDYKSLKEQVFMKGKDAGDVRKELGLMMKERTPVDPEEEREQRSEQAIKKVIQSLRSFKKDMNVLKLVPDEIVEHANGLLKELEMQVGDNAS